MPRVVISPSADADTDDISAYLAAHAGQSVAARYTSFFEALYDRLADYPAIGPRRPALGAGVRIGIISPYVVIYRYSENHDTVTVLRVIHGSRAITRKLLAGRT